MFYKNRLKELRLEKGYTQEKLADLCGVNKSLICHYERGSRTPTLESFNNLIDVLGVDANYLLGNDITIVGEPGGPKYYANMAKEDLDILKAIKINQKLYDYLLEDPARRIESLSNKI